MWRWLKDHFLPVGIAAVVLDLASRLYVQVLMERLAAWAYERDRYAAQSMELAHISTGLDLLASLTWGVFMIAFAGRVVELLERR